MGAYVEKVMLNPPIWRVVSENILDGSGMPALLDGPFYSETAAKMALTRRQSPPDNPYENY